MKRHPIQPVINVSGVHRFKSNAIVKFLLEHGLYDLNALSFRGFPQADWEQFAQLIGYSVSGALDLDYMSDRVMHVALAESVELSKKKKARKK